MVGSDSQPYETPRGGQPVKEVDLDRQLGGEQLAGGIEAGRSGPDHGHAIWALAHSVDATDAQATGSRLPQ